MEVSGYTPANLTPVQNTSTHWIGGWVGSRTGPDISEEKNLFPPYGLRTVQPVAKGQLWGHTTLKSSVLVPTLKYGLRIIKLH